MREPTFQVIFQGFEGYFCESDVPLYVDSPYKGEKLNKMTKQINI